MRLIVVCSILLEGLAGPALASGSSYILPDGTNRAPAVTLHCVGPNGGAVPCGTQANPLVVVSPGGTGGSGSPAQTGAEQASAAALGTVSDPAFSGGAGTMVSLLKALWTAEISGVPALPTGGTLTSRSVSLVAGASTQVFPGNATRRYLSFQVPQGSGVWINVMGGAAAPNAQDCAYFGPGTFYESGAFINRGAITVYAPAAGMFSAWES